MRILSAYLLAVLGGNESPKKADITKILDSVGIKADEAQLDKLIKELAGKDLDALIAEGLKKVSSVPSIGGGGGGGGAAAGGAAAKSPAAAAKKEVEKPKEKSEESGGDMGFSLFD